MNYKLNILVGALILAPWVCYGLDYESHYTVKFMTLTQNDKWPTKEATNGIISRLTPTPWPDDSQLTALCKSKFGPKYRFSGVVDAQDVRVSQTGTFIYTLLKIGFLGRPLINLATSLFDDTGQMRFSCIERRSGETPTPQQVADALNVQKVIEKLNANKLIHGEIIPPTCSPTSD